jgi:predicted solute-binding protein
MTEQLKFTTSEGEATVDPKVMAGYYSEAATYLGQEAVAKADYKLVVETVAETTNLTKRVVSKYFKARYKEATKTDKEIGEVFEILDEALREKNDE